MKTKYFSKNQIYLLRHFCHYKSNSWGHITGVKSKCCSSCCLPSPFVRACIRVFVSGDKSERGAERKRWCERHAESKVITLMGAARCA